MYYFFQSCLLLRGISAYADPNGCQPISGDAAARLTEYIQKRFKFPPKISFEISSSELIGQTCFRKVHFRSKDPDRSTELIFFVSPDQRFLSRDLLDTIVDPLEEERDKQRVMQTELTKGEFPAKGDWNAPVTIIVFSDFECPYCKRAMEVFNRELLARPSEVRLVFRNLPLPMHGWARPAAEMAACAYEQSNEAFWIVHDFLFRHQAEITLANLAEKVTDDILRADVNVEQYEECVKQHRTVDRIDKDVSFAVDHRLRGTPSVFVNGERVEVTGNADEFDAVVQKYVAAAQPQPVRDVGGLRCRTRAVCESELLSDK